MWGLLISSSFYSAPVLQPSDVFEQPHTAGPRKIEFHISVPDVTGVVDGSGPVQEVQSDEGKGSHSLF